MVLGLPGSDPGVPDLDRDLTRLGRVILVAGYLLVTLRRARRDLTSAARFLYGRD